MTGTDRARGMGRRRFLSGAGALTAAGWIAGQPSIQPMPITSAAATAPESGATIQGDTGADGTESGVAEGASAVASDGAASLAGAVSLVTSVALRSMVGGSRLGRSESGSDPVVSGLSSTIAAVPLSGYSVFKRSGHRFA